MKRITGMMGAALLSSSVFASPTINAYNTINNAPAEIQSVMASAPTEYSFASRFDGKESAIYTGQAYRQVLMSDLKSYMDSISFGEVTSADAQSTLENYILGQDVDQYDLYVTSKDDAGFAIDNLQLFYSDFGGYGKNLIDKLAGIDNDRDQNFIGYGNVTSSQEFVNTLVQAFAKNVEASSFTVPNGALAPQSITKATITPEGVDLAQVLQKFMFGAISFNQAVGDYLSTTLGADKGLNADNTVPANGTKNYTNLEHHFDEAFGYFGATRDLLAYSDQVTKDKESIDSNKDGLIDLEDEKNYGAVIYAAKMDYLSKTGTDFTGTIMNAFLKGRQLIAKAPQGYLPYLEAQAYIAGAEWERVLAATTIHYANSTIREYGKYGTQGYSFVNFTKYWSEFKGFALTLQFNPESGLMDDASFEQIQKLAGDKPALPHGSEAASYVQKLEQVKSILKNVYDFADQDVQNW
jgi:hypothetical protein